MSRRKVRRARRHTERTVEEAFLELEAGNHVLALRLARRAREEGGMNVRVLFDCATIARACGEPGEAADTLRALLAQAPDHAEACALFAELRASAGRPAAALRWLRRALASEPERASWREREAELVGLATKGPDAEDEEGAAEDEAGADGERSDAFADAEAAPGTASPAVPPAVPPAVLLAARLQRFDAAGVAAEVVARGHATLPGVLGTAERDRLLARLAKGDGLEHPHRLRAAIGGDASSGEGLRKDATANDAADAPACTVHWLQSPLPDELAVLQREFFALAALVANAMLAHLGEVPRHPLAFDHHRARRGRTAVRFAECDPGAGLPPQRSADRAAFPLRVLFDLGPAPEPAPSLVLADLRPGRKRRATAARTRPGDAVLFCCRDRLQSIAGVFGLQLVHWAAGPFPRGRVLLDIPFDDE